VAAGGHAVESGLLFELRQRLARRFADAVAIAAPGLRDLREDTREAGVAPTVFRRKVGAAEEGLQLGVSQTDIGQPRRRWQPERRTCRCGRHPGALAIHFYRHEIAIELGGDDRVSNDSRSITWHQWQVE